MGASSVALLIMMYLDYIKESKVYRSYLAVLIGVAAYTALIVPMGNTQWWIDWCDRVLDGECCSVNKWALACASQNNNLI